MSPVTALRRDESEKHFMARVRRGAEAFGWEVFHQLDSVGTRAGFPDLVLVRPPRIVFAELKSPRGRVSPAQWMMLDLLERCPGVEAYLWRPVDAPTIWQVLSGGPPALSVERER